jgi:hypothetical protein
MQEHDGALYIKLDDLPPGVTLEHFFLHRLDRETKTLP